jgi:PAS domain S-box-containing protein
LHSSGVATIPAQQAPEEDLSGMLEQFHLVLFRTNALGDFTYVSRGWETWSDQPTKASHGKALCAFLHPADRIATERSLHAIARGELGQMAAEVRIVTANGRVVPVMLRAQAWHLSNGHLAGIAGMLEELTRRKRLDERLKTARGYANTLLANVPGMVYRCRLDPSWTMEFVSDGCLDLTGYEPYELVENQRLSFGSLIHPEDREFVWAQVQSHVAQRTPYQVAYRITDASGRLRRVWEQGRGVFSSHGELLAIEGFVTDVGEGHGAEEAERRKRWFEVCTGFKSRDVFDSLLTWTLHHAQHWGHPCALLWVDAFGLAERLGTLDSEYEQQDLTTFARRFSELIGQGAAACYLGTSQFAVLLTDFPCTGEPCLVAPAREVLPAVAQTGTRLAEMLAAPLGAQGSTAPVGVAVGIALSHARYADGAALLTAARDAAKQAARLGAGHCEFADE